MGQIQLSVLCGLTLGKQVLLFVILSSLQWKSHREVRKHSRGHIACLWQSRVSRYRGFSGCGSQALEHRVSSCDIRVYLLHSMSDLPGPGIKLTSPALASKFFTTEPPGNPAFFFNGFILSPPK